MKHLGDISKINGAAIEPVDIISFGSPCQDLSVAGKRAGLEGARSGLFMEAVRIIKEMRKATDGKYPRFALWENVPGAFSSNKGEDFRVVLEELIKIVEPKAVMPAVPKNGWAYADSYVGDGWSLAYRVLDTQYWPRTPQRRRRIYLVADFGGQCAGEVLFKSDGLHGHFAKSGASWQGVAAYVENGVGAANRTAWGLTTKGNGDAFISEERHTALSTGGGQAGQGYPAAVIATATQQGGAEVSENGICPTITAAAGMSGNNQPWVVYNGENITNPLNKANPKPGDPCHTLGTDSRNYVVFPIHDQATRFSGKHGDKSDGKGNGLGIGEDGDPMNTLTSGDRHAVAYTMQGFGDYRDCGIGSGLKARDYKDATDLVVEGEHPIVFDKEVFQSGENASGGHYISEGGPAPSLRTTGHPPGVCVAGVDCRNMNEYPDLYPTLQAKPNGGQSLNFSGAVRDRYIVRRLTPTECARLQGFPDKWGHPNKKESLSDEEYEFWLEVRNTHAAINGKAVKDYTKAQMEKWYNKLHSDSAEYKMWGNGIALPTALYVMQGIADALPESEVIHECEFCL